MISKLSLSGKQRKHSVVCFVEEVFLSLLTLGISTKEILFYCKSKGGV